jgi:AcrR family transcriptional regulator
MATTPEDSAGGAEPRAPKPHEQLVDLAARQLNLRGAGRTSLEKIGAKLGMSTNAVNHLVTDRQHLVFLCYERAAHTTARRLCEATRDGGTPADVVRNFIVRMLDPSAPEIAAHAESHMMTREQRDTVQGIYDAVAARLARLIEAGQRAGVLRLCDAEVNARAVLSLVEWAPLAGRWANIVGSLSSERVTAEAIAILVGGLSPEHTPAAFEPFDLTGLAPRVVQLFDRNSVLSVKREALLRSASRLFNRNGIDATSMKDVAERAGITPSVLLDHFPAKRDLVMACYERTYRICFAVIDSMHESPQAERQKVMASVHASATTYMDENLSPLSPALGYATLSLEDCKRINDWGLKLNHNYRELCEHGIESGSMRQHDAAARTLVLAGLTSWLAKTEIRRDCITRERIAREVAALADVSLQP